MIDEKGFDGGSDAATLAHAEAAFQKALDTIGRAQRSLWGQVENGELPETDAVTRAIDRLGVAWKSAQTERERVAKSRRERGELVGGDLDTDAARIAISEQLARIARSLEAEDVPEGT